MKLPFESKVSRVSRIRQNAANTRFEAERAFAHSRAVRGYPPVLTIAESALLALSEDCTRRMKRCDAALKNLR